MGLIDTLIEERHNQTYGPFGGTVWAVFLDFGTHFRIVWDSGPEYDISVLTNDQATVVKVPPGMKVNLTVTAVCRRWFKLEACLISAATSVRTSKDGTILDDQPEDPVAMCGSMNCFESIECPDAEKPYMRCNSSGTGGFECSPEEVDK